MPRLRCVEALERRALLSLVPHTLTVSLFRDRNVNAIHDAGEAGLAGWHVHADDLRDADGNPTSADAISDSSGDASFITYVDPQRAEDVLPRFSVPRSRHFWCTNQLADRQSYLASASPGDARTSAADGADVSFALADWVIATGSVTNRFLMSDGGGALSGTPLFGRRVFEDVNGDGVLDAGEPFTITDLDGNYRFKLRAGVHTLRLEQGGGWTAVRGERDAQSISIDLMRNALAHVAAPDFSTRMQRSIVVDLAVGYTAAAAAGRDAIAMLAFVRDLVADANRPFANSGTAVLLNLVRVQPSDYVEAGNISRDLSRLRDRSDGYADDVARMRERFRADLAVLLTNSPTSGGNEIGLSFEFNRHGGADLGFSIVALQHDSHDWVTLAHEIGHNLGAGHDPANGSGGEPARYAHGIRIRSEDGKVYKDVMAYGSGTVLPLFSSPDLFFAGKRFGDVKTMDNARSIEESAQLVAQYR